MNRMSKPFTCVDAQIEILKSRSMVISNPDDARVKLLHNNYYTLINGYKYPFLDKQAEKETFVEGTTFDEVFSLYSFDCKFRALLLKYILKVEHQLKSVLSHHFAQMHQDEKYPDYLCPENFDISNGGKMPPKKAERYQTLRADISKELDKQLDKHNHMLEHYKSEYDNIPPWILVSIFSFGMLRSFYYCLGNKDQNEISRKLGLRPDELDMYLSALNIYRNACAHDERIYNKRINNKVVRKDLNGNKKEYRNVYVVILILKDLLDSTSFMSFYSTLDDYICELQKSLRSVKIESIFQEMGMPVDRAVRKAELGPLDRGNALSDEEFKEVLQRYIAPILPINVTVKSVLDDDRNKANPSCKMVARKDNTIYFAQGVNSAFVYCIPLNGKIVPQNQVDDIERHLSVLIDYIHIFWNLSNLSSFGRDKVSVAFPMLCEQAYELAICELMCHQESTRERKKFAEENKKYRQNVGEVSVENRQELASEIRHREREINLMTEHEAIAEKTLYGILSQIEAWSTRTYEGQKKTFGIIMCTDSVPENGGSFDYVDFLRSDYSATINDGIYSAVEVYANGSFKDHLTMDGSSGQRIPSVPYPFSKFALLCDRNKIGVVLTDSGDILVINDKKLCYTKHNGVWLCSMTEKVLDQIAQNVPTISREQAEIIYQAVVDVSYSRGGACIGIISSERVPAALSEMIQAGILSTDEPSKKLLALKTMISFGAEPNVRQKSFYELDRALRRELLELDGAMVLSSGGKIHVIGTIIKLDASGSDGGGRTAAAKQLSQFGLAIKVSQDGYVQLFRNQKVILEIMA